MAISTANVDSGSDSPRLARAQIKETIDAVNNLETSAGSAGVGFIQSGTGAVATTVQADARTFVKVSQFGVLPSASAAVNGTGFATAITAAVAGGFGLRIPAGTYDYDTKLSITSSKLRIIADGKVYLNFTGTGKAVEIDGGAVGQIYDVVFGGENAIEIDGNASATDGLYMRATHHSNINVKVRNVSAAGMRMVWGVCNEVRVVCSSNQGAFTTTPVNGLVMEARSAGEYCAANTFINPIIEDVSATGIVMTAAVNNTFLGGTSEANNKGVELATDSYGNHFVGMWCEANTVNDFEIYGSDNEFSNVRAMSSSSGLNVAIISAVGTKFFGGYLRAADCQATSSRSSFICVESSDNASLGIRGSGTYQTLYCTESGTNGVITAKVPDDVGESGLTWTPYLTSTGGGAQGAVTLAVGSYTRIGRMGFFSGNISIAKGTLGAGNVSVTGFPYAARNTTNSPQYLNVGAWSNIALAAGNSHLSIRLNPNTTDGQLIQSGLSTAASNVTLAALPDPIVFSFTGSYEIVP